MPMACHILPQVSSLAQYPARGLGAERDTRGQRQAARAEFLMAPCVVMVKDQASRGVPVQFSKAVWLRSRVKVARTGPEPFCDSRRLWDTPCYKSSVLRGWRPGRPPSSLGGTYIVKTNWE